MTFVDLPLELLPLIVQHLLRPHHLAQACLVNKDFYTCTVPQLYERVAIFSWHKDGKKKVTQLFWTLANCPRLARFVHRLELRDFPKAVSRESVNELVQLCVNGLTNCTNLVSCTWTRDGTLKDDVLVALSQCPSLTSLEINGRHARNYDPSILTKFQRLHRISMIMPSAEVVHVLPECFQRNSETLKELIIICKFTSVITDGWLEMWAPYMSRLKKLHLAGCPKVTHAGIMHVLRCNNAGIIDLALEGLSSTFDMQRLAATCSQALSSLSSITLTFPVVGVNHSWLSEVEALLFDASALKQFHLYASGYQLVNPLSLDTDFVQRFIGRHGDSLTRFAVLRLPVSIQALEYILQNGHRLEQLFVSVWRKDLNKLGPIIAQSRTLRTLHVTYAYSTIADRENNINTAPDTIVRSEHYNGISDEESDPYSVQPESDSSTNRISVGTSMNPLPSMSELEDLASEFGGNVTQFGVQTRVWQVERVLTTDSEDGGEGARLTRRVKLAPYESPDVPGVFLVVRT